MRSAGCVRIRARLPPSPPEGLGGLQMVSTECDFCRDTAIVTGTRPWNPFDQPVQSLGSPKSLLQPKMAPSKVIWHRLAAASGLSAVALGAYGEGSPRFSRQQRQCTCGASQAISAEQVPTSSDQQTSNMWKCGSGAMNII